MVVGDQPVQEAAAPPPARPARLPGQRPGQQHLAAGAGDPDVEQPALLLDRVVVAVGVLDGQRAVGQPDEEHDVPLQALRRVQRGQRDALHGRRVRGVGPGVQLGGEPAQVGVRLDRDQLLGQLDQREQRLPLGALGGTAGRLRGETDRGQHGAHGVGQRRVATGAAVRSTLIARRTSGRWKNRSPPRTW